MKLDRILDWILDTGYPDTGYWKLEMDTGYWTLDTRHWTVWTPGAGLLGHRGLGARLGAGCGWAGSMLLEVVYIVVDTLLYLHL